MTKNLSLLLFLLLLSPLALAQLLLSENDGFCQTSSPPQWQAKLLPWYGDNTYLNDILDTIGYYQQTLNDENTLYRVPLQFWVYRNSDGSGGISDAELKQALTDLNHFNAANNTGFLYYMLPDVRYINHSARTTLGYYFEKPWMTTIHRKRGCINVHVAENIKAAQRGHDKSFRGSYNKVNQAITIRRVSSSTTLAHEIGHYFGLLHPHRNSGRGRCKAEAANSRRRLRGCFRHGLICEKNGDYICDTPAEPMLLKYVDNQCNYIGKLTDPWGDLYAPQTTNIMSYPRKMFCRQAFTPGQVAVMHHYAKRKAAAAWDCKNVADGEYKHQYLFDSHEPDNTAAMADKLVPDSTQRHTFHKVYKYDTESEEDTDWVWFEVKETATVVLHAAHGMYKQTNVQLTLFDKQLDTVCEATTMIERQLTRGIYYLQLDNKKHIASPDIADYKLTLTIKAIGQ